MTDLTPRPVAVSLPIGAKWDYPCTRFSALLADINTCGYCKWPLRTHVPLEVRHWLGIPSPPSEHYCSHCGGPLLPDDPRDARYEARHRLCRRENDH